MKESSFQLKGQPRILDLNFKSNQEVIEKKESLKLNIQIGGDSKIFEDKNEALVSLNIKLTSPEEERSFFSLEATIGANFILDEKATKKEIEKEVENAMLFTKESPYPDKRDLLNNVFKI